MRKGPVDSAGPFLRAIPGKCEAAFLELCKNKEIEHFRDSKKSEPVLESERL
jgi:hypothetical protein